MTQNDQPQSTQQSLKSNFRSAPGPLTVSQSNPRYFTVASNNETAQRAIYLTGSHIWNNFHDGMGPGSNCSETPEQFDYDAYLEFLKEHGHNFIRLWRWEQFKSQAAGGSFHLCMTPQPWARTGPGTAKDGKPRFDLDEFDGAFFDRLRDRVVAAGERGMYVAVMFFEGWGLHLSPAPDHVEGHPFHAGSNVNGIGIGSTRACKSSKRRTSARWWTRSTISRTSSGRWRTSPRAAARPTASSRTRSGSRTSASGAT